MSILFLFVFFPGLQMNGFWHSVLVVLAWLYFGLSIWLSLYGTNMFALTVLLGVTSVRRKESKKTASELPENLPVVTIQLPLYNEKQVARRLINTVARLDYPIDRIQIQILDDSTDNTAVLVQKVVEYWKRRGRWIELHHRANRTDFKAGALREGLETAKGEFIAIFDADFLPPADWLKRALAPFFEAKGEKVGLVQTRWGHLNEDYSLLTRAQALALDGHFAVEQRARSSAGLMFGFNGTAGIWRRSCIESAGNWCGDTLTEDLDLSYRAQINGWQFAYLPDVSAPAELPTMMVGFKRQQFRWAKGGIQVTKLVGPELVRSHTSLWCKIEGLLHMSAYMTHPLMLILQLLMLPLTLFASRFLWSLPWGLLWVATLGPFFLFGVAQHLLYREEGWLHWILRMPLLVMLGIGLAVNNTRAVLEALFNIDSPFERTPKFGVVHEKLPAQRVIKEQIKIDATTWMELFLALYAVANAVVNIKFGNWFGGLICGVYAAGFAWVSLATLWEAQLSGSQRRAGEKSLAA